LSVDSSRVSGQGRSTAQVRARSKGQVQPQEREIQVQLAQGFLAQEQAEQGKILRWVLVLVLVRLRQGQVQLRLQREKPAPRVGQCGLAVVQPQKRHWLELRAGLAHWMEEMLEQILLGNLWQAGKPAEDAKS
jgi:hypothetical protein